MLRSHFLSSTLPQADIVVEAHRLLDAARAEHVPVRLIGGLAVRLGIPDGTELIFERAYKDIDLVTPKGRGREVIRFMAGMGYEPDKVFNATNGHRRLLFYDLPHERQVDVFVGTFGMCHEIPITERIELTGPAIPLAELLLTKMQIVELNTKDQTDILTMLYHHDVGHDDADLINADRIAELCAADWGLWRTTKMNVERIRDALPESGLTAEQRALVLTRLERLWARVDAEPKSTKWKLRNRVGDKVRWYEEPEEVA
jgi:hypothetical protein